ncbi:hypothetical protein M422DRAFT_196239 [Sphaerobolus stellatus SS14]|uniref:NAD(P)-binding protein n=1 Tax=Sphaerobolus stellatus (strain SS14) TaxID=990650 RepID=A0A0C9UDH1_SPHS4|nr:hypothetical protein M422DRAFT_196239 [Sphaerobolus stellatus SS14]
MPSYLVTGASHGIGLEFVRQLVSSENNTVFALVRNKETARKVPSTILTNELPNLHVLEADVTDAGALKLAMEKAAQVTGGKLDVIINNAAAISGENDWRRIIDLFVLAKVKRSFWSFKVNVTGVILATLVFLPLLRKGSLKKIVTISSLGGEREFVVKSKVTGMSAYGASKAAVNMVVTKLALELEPEGFVVIALSPGLADTTGTLPQKRKHLITPCFFAIFNPCSQYLKSI